MWWYPDRRLIRATVRAGTVGNYPIGSPTRMLLAVQPPGTALTGQVLSTSPSVVFMDSFGNIVPNVGVVVTATPSVGTMSGTLAIQADANSAVFSNLIFDDIVNTVIGSRTITFSCPGFANIVSAPVVVTDSTLKFWVEADYGVVDAAGAPLTTWADRGPNAANVTTGPTKGAPVYRASGFGGAALPYWELNNAHGMSTQSVLGLALTSYTEFNVVQRDVADANCCISIMLMVDAIASAIQDAAASLYVARWNAGHTILQESSYNNAGGWIPKGSRQIIRQECDGTHAGHKAYLNSVLQALPDQFVTNPGLVSTGALTIRMGYRDPALPALDMQGQFAAKMVFAPALTATKALSVEAYLAKWLAAGPAVPAAFRGPILLETSVIDGVTIQVLSYVASNDIKSGSPNEFHQLIFLFSEPIKRFAATQVAPINDPTDYKMMIGVNNYTSLWTWDFVAGGSFNLQNQRTQINDTVTGFTAVIVRDGFSTGGFGDTILQNIRFSKMSDP